MNKLKSTAVVIAMVLMTAFSMTGCAETEKNTASSFDESLSAQSVSVAEKVKALNKPQTNSEYFDTDDLDASCDSVDAEITLNGSSVDIKGIGAEFTDKRIGISKGGTYLFSGKLDDGQIYVNTKEKVHIVLNGADISCSDSSPIFIEDSDNAVITVSGENTLSDSTNYVYENADENEPDAVIYSKDDLSVNGEGTLNITANYNEGLTSKNDLRISGITLNVISAGNSVKGKDSLAIMDAVINIQSKADGLKSSNAEKLDKGYVAIESGELNITAAQDAVQAETDIIVNGGTLNIKTGTSEDKTAETKTTDNESQQPFGFKGRGFMGEGNPDKTDDSEKGFKSVNSIKINGGHITADCADDAVHSNGSVEINEGTLELSSGDDGIHAGKQVDINDGNVNISKSYEGIEGTVINVNGGTVRVKASDDGFNASDGSNSEENNTSAFGKMGGGFGDVSENCILTINDGYVYVNAEGDGLDSNGTININGGTVLVDGPVNDGNAALDSGSEILVNGGTLIAAGSSGMAELPSDTSKQYSLVVGFEQSQAAETLISIQKDKQNIITYSPSKQYSCVIISSPGIVKGNEYSVYYGGKCTGNETDGLYSGGEYSGGTLLGTESAETTVTQIGTVIAGTGMMHGHGGHKPDGFGNGESPENIPEIPNGMTLPNDFDKSMQPPDGFKNENSNL